MALEINNATFNAFVNFAQTQEAAGKQKAVARLVDAPKDGPLAGRNIKAAVADIFNGEDNIPVKYAVEKPITTIMTDRDENER